MSITFADLSATVAVDARDPVLAILRRITRSWALAPATPGDEAQIVVRRSGDRVVIESPGDDETLLEPTAVSGACSLVLRIVQRSVADRPDLLCLHAGAVRIGDALVLLPSGRRAGKSTLLAHLAFRGAEVFADDVLPIERDTLTAIAPGIACRLRTPLPTDIPPAFARFCTDRAGPRDTWYTFLDHPPATLAEAGRRAPISAIVLLQRGERGEGGLARIPPAAALEALLLQNFGVAGSASEILSALKRLSTTRPAFTLGYASLDRAADILLDAFGPDGTIAPSTWSAVPQRAVAGRRDAPYELDASTRRVRSVTARISRLDGTSFVADDATGTIVALAGVGPIIWELLEEPISITEIESALGDLYPDIPATRIARDTRSFLALLDEHGLLGSA